MRLKEAIEHLLPLTRVTWATFTGLGRGSEARTLAIPKCRSQLVLERICKSDCIDGGSRRFDDRWAGFFQQKCTPVHFRVLTLGSIYNTNH